MENKIFSQNCHDKVNNIQKQFQMKNYNTNQVDTRTNRTPRGGGGGGGII